MATPGPKPDAAGVQLPLALVPPPAPLLCPAEVAGWPEARAVWDLTLAGLPAGRLHPMHAPLLAAYCTACALAQRATAQLRETGELVEVDGKPVASPYVLMQRQQAEQARKLAVELGLTPAELVRAALTSRAGAA